MYHICPINKINGTNITFHHIGSKYFYINSIKINDYLLIFYFLYSLIRLFFKNHLILSILFEWKLNDDLMCCVLV